MVNIEQNLSIIQSLCKRFNVKQLFVFGSVNREDFAESSDIDFLVEFNRTGIKGSFDQYFDFKEALNRLLRIVPDLEEKLPEAHRIIGLRNIITHGYVS
jgi:uncharacterized protein